METFVFNASPPSEMEAIDAAKRGQGARRFAIFWVRFAPQLASLGTRRKVKCRS
jgi:hypothetical protein